MACLQGGTSSEIFPVRDRLLFLEEEKTGKRCSKKTLNHPYCCEFKRNKHVPILSKMFFCQIIFIKTEYQRKYSL